MEIIYKKNNIASNVCNMEKVFLAKAGSGNFVYLAGNKIIKVFQKPDNEIPNYLYMIQHCKNPIVNNFITHFDYIVKCDNEIYIAMDRNEFMLDKEFISDKSSKIKKCLLLQALLVIYYFNHDCKLFFNDIYTYHTLVRNTMVNKKDIEIKDIIDIPKCGYQLKFIDYGHVSTRPKLRTRDYINRYFPQLAKHNIYSEVLLFTLFYARINGEKFKDIQTKLELVSNQLLKKTKNAQTFDKLFIKYVQEQNLKKH